jgi:hypothetical protein
VVSDLDGKVNRHSQRNAKNINDRQRLVLKGVTNYVTIEDAKH